MKDVSLICQLQKSLCGLKKDSKSLYENIGIFFLNLGFHCCESDHSIYVLHVNTFIIRLYVNDLFINGNNVYLILSVKKQLLPKTSLVYFFLEVDNFPFQPKFFPSSLPFNFLRCVRYTTFLINATLL